jgi:hypothetical protein
MNGYELNGVWIRLRQGYGGQVVRRACSEMPETRQHFFLFFPDFLFLPVVSSPAALRAKANEGAPFT